GVVMGTSNVDDSFSVNMLSALDEAAHEIDKILLVGTGKDTEAQEERIEELIGHNVDSLIVMPSNNSDLTKTLENYVDNLPIVQIGGTTTSFHV
ncbi:LacI family transcriptional regulator, partial [Bifidobacteriaceae bacterium WP022]